MWSTCWMRMDARRHCPCWPRRRSPAASSTGWYSGGSARCLGQRSVAYADPGSGRGWVQRAQLRSHRVRDLPAPTEAAQLAPERTRAREGLASRRVGGLAGAATLVEQQIDDRGGAHPVEALDLARRQRVAGALAQAAHHELPLLRLLERHDRVEDALVRAEREQRALDDALDQSIAIDVPVVQHLPDQAPAIAALRGVEAGFPVDVAQGPRLEAHHQLDGDVVVVRVHVGREVREIAPGERLLALVARALDDLPADRPAVTVRVEAPGVLLGVHDVGGNAAVEVREPVAA